MKPSSFKQNIDCEYYNFCLSFQDSSLQIVWQREMLQDEV